MSNKDEDLSVTSQDDLLELYKTAYSRLQFQDEYLFKFSAVFLTVEGALGFLVRTGIESDIYKKEILLLAGILGLVLSFVWAAWIRNNDYWHTVWIGVLRSIENDLRTKHRVFSVKHEQVARDGGQKRCWVFRGHHIALAIPFILSLAWIFIAVSALCMYQV